MIFRQLFDHESSTYTYLIAEDYGREALLVDPVLEQLPAYLRLIDELNLKLVKAVDTHVHADHITALGRLRDEQGCTTVMGQHSKADCVSLKVQEGDLVKVDGLKMRAIYTPGHTDDSYSFYFNDRIFTGDTLLIRGSGRTDFQNGNPYDQYDSIFNKLLKFPEDTMVYPAHDYKGWTVSTIGEEKYTNPRLQVSSPQEYADIMNSLNLPDPKMMDIAVPANQACGKIPATNTR